MPVSPDGHRTQVERAAGAAAVDELGQRVRQAARADVVDRQDRIRVAQLPAAVDHLLRAALDLGVAALHRVEVQVRRVRAGRHRRRGAAAQPDQQARSAELHDQRAVGERMLAGVARVDVADAAGDHDRLVVAAHLAADVLLERAEVAAEVRAAELVVERRGADRTLQHDRERRGDAPGLLERRLPGLGVPRHAQMRHRVADQPRLGLRADAGRALVADLAARPGRGAGERRDRGRVVVRLDLHQRVRQRVVRAVAAIAVRVEASDPCPLHHRGVVRVGDDGALRMRRVRVADHAEQALRLRNAVDDPARVEDLVAAVLGVRLREHHELDVGRVAAERAERGVEVVDLVVGECQPQLGVRAFERAAALGEERHRRERTRLDVREQHVRFVGTVEDRLGHPVADQRHERLAVGARQRLAAARRRMPVDAALDAANRVETTVARDVGRLRRPRRDRAGPRHDDERRARPPPAGRRPARRSAAGRGRCAPRERAAIRARRNGATSRRARRRRSRAARRGGCRGAWRDGTTRRPIGRAARGYRPSRRASA